MFVNNLEKHVMASHQLANSSFANHHREMITIRFAGWISGRIVSLQQDMDIQKLLSNGNQIRTRISETLLAIFRGYRLLEKVAHCTIIHLVSSEPPFHPSVPWLRVCLRCKLCTQGHNEGRWCPGQKASLAPPWSNLSSFERKFTILKKVLVTLLRLFDASCSNSTPS